MSRVAPKAAYQAVSTEHTTTTDHLNNWNNVVELKFESLRLWQKISMVANLLLCAGSVIMCILHTNYDNFRWHLFQLQAIKWGTPDYNEGALLHPVLVYPVYMAPALFGMAFVSDAFTMTRKDDHRDFIQQYHNPRRWLEYALIHGYAAFLLTVLTGVASFVLVIGIFCLNAAHNFVMYAQEALLLHQNLMVVRVMAVVTIVVTWGMQCIIFYNSYEVYDAWFKALFISSVCVFFGLFGLQMFHMNRRIPLTATRQIQMEKWYLLTAGAIRVAVVAQILAGAW
jgi:hypothetical protein